MGGGEDREKIFFNKKNFSGTVKREVAKKPRAKACLENLRKKRAGFNEKGREDKQENRNEKTGKKKIGGVGRSHAVGPAGKRRKPLRIVEGSKPRGRKNWRCQDFFTKERVSAYRRGDVRGSWRVTLRTACRNQTGRRKREIRDRGRFKGDAHLPRGLEDSTRGVVTIH